ncbi:MAG TPA: hypothetical protein VHO68_08120, partial [Bacteroidales bacterium]|nr:hypothetical protein [Bacteroidales bacterium]
MLVVLCLIGAIALILFTRDNPQYADGEPTAIIKDWLSKQPPITLSALDKITASASILDEDQGPTIWMEEYLGSGKWLVERANLPSSNNENLTF